MFKKLALLALGVAFATLLVGCGDSSPREVAVSFIENAYKGNGDKLMKYIALPADVAAKAGTKEMIEGKLKNVAQEAEKKAKEAGGLAEIEVESEEVQEDTARVNILVHFKDGDTQTERVNLIKDNGKWKIKL